MKVVAAIVTGLLLIICVLIQPSLAIHKAAQKSEVRV